MPNLRTGRATARQSICCRICGYRGSLAYCSQCGLPFDYAAESTLQLLRSRGKMLVQPIFHFLVTWLLLAFAPKAFFQSLMTGGRPVNASLLLWTNPPTKFTPWFRPMTPVGYFIFGGLAFGVAGKYFELFDSIIKIIDSHTGAKSWSASSNLHSLFVEGIWCSVIFALIVPYKVILGIPRSHSRNAMEYCLYVLIQYWICTFGIFAVAIVLEKYIPLPENLAFFLNVTALGLSLYYFVIVPVIFLRPQFHVRISRILCSFATMCVVQILLLLAWLFILIWDVPFLDLLYP